MIFIHHFHHSFLSAKRVHHGVLVGLVFDSFSSAFKCRVVVMMKWSTVGRNILKIFKAAVASTPDIKPQWHNGVFAAAKSIGTSLHWEKTVRRLGEHRENHQFMVREEHFLWRLDSDPDLFSRARSRSGERAGFQAGDQTNFGFSFIVMALGSSPYHIPLDN